MHTEQTPEGVYLLQIHSSWLKNIVAKNTREVQISSTLNLRSRKESLFRWTITALSWDTCIYEIDAIFATFPADPFMGVGGGDCVYMYI